MSSACETSRTDSNSLQEFNTSDENKEQITESQSNSLLDSTFNAENTYSFITKTTNILNNDQELLIAIPAITPYDVINSIHLLYSKIFIFFNAQLIISILINNIIRNKYENKPPF